MSLRQLFCLGFLVVAVPVGIVVLSQEPASKGQGPAEVSAVVAPAQADVSVPEMDVNSTVTKGNHSYVPIFVKWSDYEKKQKAATGILSALDAFEKAHPELEVTGWHSMYNYTNNASIPNYMDGLWIDHRPRQNSTSGETATQPR